MSLPNVEFILCGHMLKNTVPDTEILVFSQMMVVNNLSNDCEIKSSFFFFLHLENFLTES